MDRQILEAISIAMEKIEKRYPNKYQELAKWQKLKAYRDKCSCELTKSEFKFHRDKFERTQDEESAKLIKTYERLIEKYENENKKVD